MNKYHLPLESWQKTNKQFYPTRWCKRGGGVPSKPPPLQSIQEEAWKRRGGRVEEYSPPLYTLALRVIQVKIKSQIQKVLPIFPGTHISLQVVHKARATIKGAFPGGHRLVRRKSNDRVQRRSITPPGFSDKHPPPEQLTPQVWTVFQASNYCITVCMHGYGMWVI